MFAASRAVADADRAMPFAAERIRHRFGISQRRKVGNPCFERVGAKKFIVNHVRAHA